MLFVLAIARVLRGAALVWAFGCIAVMGWYMGAGNVPAALLAVIVAVPGVIVARLTRVPDDLRDGGNTP